eukprot:3677502-Amphidinium_carterae.1
MPLFPTEAKFAAFTSLLEIRTWVGLDAPAFAAFESVVGNLQNSVRNLALLQANHVRMAVESTRVPVQNGDARPLT